VFNVDGSGNRYTVAQGVKLVTDAAQIPVFKADGVGVGDGLLGGYVLSYESIGKQTGQIVLDVLDGAAMPSVTGYTTGSCEYLFDANVMHRYGISKSQLPAGSVYLNDTPDFLETYGWVLMWSLVGVAVLIAIIIGFNQRRHHQMQRELAERDIELKAEEAANHAKTVFISRMSHDIRTPLNAMLGMNELALVNIEDERAVRDYLGKAHASGELLLSLVNNILDVSKIESGKMQIAPEPCELKAFCADLHDIFAPLCERKNINLIIRQDAGDAVVLADRVRLNQVFCNLLSNAIKFTPDGGTVIFELAGTASDEESPEQILHCDFTVSDTGPGIADDFRDKMFQPFVQDTRDSSPDNQGSGLGLMIVRSIVELMNGSIAVESAADAGTSFQVHLDFPLTDRSGESAQGKAAATQSPSDGADPAIAGHRALVVEDNDLNAEIIIAMLERAGMEVERAVNGQEAVDMVAASPDGAFDIILMDNRMPVMTGMDAARAIRSMDRVWTARIPIIALTADVFDDDVRNLMDAGMDACLSKPIDARKLFQTIAEHLERTS